MLPVKTSIHCIETIDDLLKENVEIKAINRRLENQEKGMMQQMREDLLDNIDQQMKSSFDTAEMRDKTNPNSEKDVIQMNSNGGVIYRKTDDSNGLYASINKSVIESGSDQTESEKVMSPIYQDISDTLMTAKSQVENAEVTKGENSDQSQNATSPIYQDISMLPPNAELLHSKTSEEEPLILNGDMKFAKVQPRIIFDRSLHTSTQSLHLNFPDKRSDSTLLSDVVEAMNDKNLSKSDPQINGGTFERTNKKKKWWKKLMRRSKPKNSYQNL